MLIPKKPKKSKQSKRDWFDKRKIKEPVKKELAERTKALIEKKSKSQMKEVIFSYMCPGCKSSFSAGNLQTRIIEAARRSDTYISCPKCGVYLIADRTTKVSTKQNSKVNRNANLTAIYSNQGITPEYAPNTWVDRALLEKIAHELGKFAASVGMFNPQLKFQRGIRGKVSVNAPENIKAAEFTVEAVDDYDLRFRVVASAGITPAGKVVLPKYFMTLDGREIPFTKEAVAEFLSGKVFGPTDPKPVVPELHYKDRDPVRFREIVASRKKKARTTTWPFPFSQVDASRLEKLMQDVISGRIIVKDSSFTEELTPIFGEDDDDLYNSLYGEWEEEEDEKLRPLSAEKAITVIKNHIKDFLNEYEQDPEVRGQLDPETKEILEGIVSRASKKRVVKKAAEKYLGNTGPIADWLSNLLDDKETLKGTEGESIQMRNNVYEITAIIEDTEVNEPYVEWNLKGTITSIEGKTVGTFRALVDTYDGVRDVYTKSASKKKAAGTPTPGQTVEYQGKNYTIDSITGDASILTDEAGVQTAPVPNADLNVQFEEGAMPTEISAPTLADRINKLVKRSLRDEKTLVPFTDPDPDYSVAEQTKVDPDFSVPYKDSDQGILSEEDRAVQKMFRGGSVIKPVKTAATVPYSKVDGEFFEDWSNGVLDTSLELLETGKKSFENVLTEWLNEKQFVLSSDEYEKLLKAFKDEWEVAMRESKESSIKKTTAIDIGSRVKVPNGREGTVTAITPDYFDPEKEEEITVYTVAIDLGELTPFELHELTRISGEKERGYATRKKTAEPTGYHETDDTGKVIELSRLRTLVLDYARAGQIPLDFDLTKVMSEVSRMTRKDLLEIIDKKQKDTHYPVVHAKKEGLEKKAELNPMQQEVFKRVQERFPGVKDEYIMGCLNQAINYAQEFPEEEEMTEEKLYQSTVGAIKDDIHEASKKKKISSKSTNAIVREIRKADLTEEDVKKDIKEEEEGEKHYNQMAKDVDSPKTEKVLKDMADEEAEHAEDLEEIVLPAVKNVKNYLEKYDSRKKKADSLEINKMYTTKQLEALGYTYWEAMALGDDNVATNPETGESYRVKQEGYNNWVIVKKFSSKKIAQEEEVEEEEKPKTTLKELKTKPHGRPAPEEVAEAPAAAPELQTVFNEVKKHQQRLAEIRALINKARQKTEEEIRNIQEEQGSVAEAAELQEGIEKLSSLIEQSESQIADLGEFFVWLDTESKTKKFKANDKWRVEKLLEKFGKDAEDYLTKAEKGASSLNTEIEQRLLTVFPKLPKDKEGSIQKEADVLSAITELGSGLWSYVKEISGIISEGEQLELELK